MTNCYVKLGIALLLATFTVICGAEPNIAQGGVDTSLGEAASSVTTLLSHAHGIIEAVFFLCGTALGTSAFLKYRLHRRNPQQVPLMTPVTEAVVAIILFAIPLIVDFSSSSHAVESAKPATDTGHYRLPPPGSAGAPNPAAPPPVSPYPH